LVLSTVDRLPIWASELLQTQRIGHLGLLDAASHPRVLPVTFALHDGAIWTIVDNKRKRQETEPARLRWLRARPRAALTIDRYDENWSALAWVQLLGHVAILEASGHDEAVAALTRRYPQYEADPPPGPLLRLTPGRALWWRETES
jgi:PPOX class probable F420-dependent enzyme